MREGGMLPIKIELEISGRTVTERDLYQWIDGNVEGLSKEDARRVMAAIQRFVIDLTLINRALLGYVVPDGGSPA